MSAIRRQGEPPPIPEPLAPLIDAHTHLDACGATTPATCARSWTAPRRRGCRRSSPSPTTWIGAMGGPGGRLGSPRLRRGGPAPHPRQRADRGGAHGASSGWPSIPGWSRSGRPAWTCTGPAGCEGCAEPAEQREAFAWHIDLAKRTGKPLMIHNRDADAEVLDVLRAEGAPETVIFHCFSSDAEMARTCVGAGWLLSLSGTVSFRNAHELREAAALIPRRAAPRRDRRAVSDPAPLPRRAERALLPALHCASAGRHRRPARRDDRRGEFRDGGAGLRPGELPLVDLFVTVL